MSKPTGQSDVDRVRNETDLLELIGEHVALRPKGREHIGLCPFHDDRRPSFHVVTHKGDGFYKCFACGAAGDAFQFAQDYHHMSFAEALRYLAERAGIVLSGSATKRQTGSDDTSRESLRLAASEAMQFFQTIYRHARHGQASRKLVEERGISDEMVEAFGIGAAPDRWDGLLSTIQSTGRSTKPALAAGLLKERTDGSGLYDYFRNRVMFPICDMTGRPVAYGGRQLSPDDEPKYINSPETAIFNKSAVLFGLPQARKAIVASGSAIITEGYTDVIACHQAGICNVVGVLGTALTEAHARMLKRLCTEVVLLFDNDEAGRRATDRAIEVFFAEPVDVKICILDGVKDPDELLTRDDGKQQLLEAVESADDALTYKLMRLRAELAEAGGISARQGLLERFVDELARLGFGRVQGVRKIFVIDKLQQLFGLPQATVEEAIARSNTRRSRPAASAQSTQPELTQDEMASDPSLFDDRGTVIVPRKRRQAERHLLGLLIAHPDLAVRPIQGDEESASVCNRFVPDDFHDAPCRRIAEVIFPWMRERVDFSMSGVLRELDRSDHRAVAVRMFDGAQGCMEANELGVGELLMAYVADFERTQREGTEENLSPLDRIKRRKQEGYRPEAILPGLRG